MPTKPEQADLNMALYGRHGESPLPVLAPATPSECFRIMIEAARIAITHMTPVIVLSDAYIANAATPWLLPDIDALPDIQPQFRTDPEGFQPFDRDPETLARPWAVPGTPGLAHRLGGIERGADSGHISYDPDNHQQMSDLRAEKIARVADDGLDHEIDSGVTAGDVLVVGWGSTYGALEDAVSNLAGEGLSVGHLHLRQLWPLPRNLGAILSRFRDVVVAELNQGQLVRLIRSEFLVDATSLTQMDGHPFKVSTIEAELRAALRADPESRRMSETIIRLTPKDFTTDQENRWCPGCGDYAILKSVRKALAEIGRNPDEVVFVSGIGCAARFPYYVETYGFHTIHGRAPSLATGVKLANPRPGRLGRWRRRRFLCRSAATI